MPAMSSTLSDSAVRRVTRSEELIAFSISLASAMTALTPAPSRACDWMAARSPITATMPLTALVT